MNNRLVITDVGSTTTKAIYLEKKSDFYRLKGLSSAITTVEKPYEDVKIGVYNSIKKLEKATSKDILSNKATVTNLEFLPDVSYLTTSSAGGGLQILVIGLTLFDSAKSAERAAYGAGGVLLNTLAINDKRTTYEQIQVINNSHPDIILFSGGTDGGAFSGVVRLAEILSVGKPSSKFSSESKIPLIYVGNHTAQDFVKTLFSSDYDLAILPNIRPSLDKEVLGPVTEKIHELFLNNVMENAPGYSQLKSLVYSDILPTPLAVLKLIEILKDKQTISLLKVDIGGATTDIFSVINSRVYRTVSANYGMSYSISNILAVVGYEKVKKLLPVSFGEDLIRNYIGNKMLNPGYVPQNELEIIIEQAVAILALRLSLNQHYEMHLNTSKIGFLENIKSRFRDPFYDQMYQEKVSEQSKFHHSDIELVIGAGGVISHTRNTMQAFYIILRGFRVEGITRIWRDKHFISPHLGALSMVDKEIAYNLLINDCYEELGIVIRPKILKKRVDKDVMSLIIDSQEYSFKVNQIRLFNIDKPTQVKIELSKEAKIKDINNEVSFETDKPILVITYPEGEIDNIHLINEMKLYDMDINSVNQVYDSDHVISIEDRYFSEKGCFTGERKLPYQGEITVKVGENLNPDTEYGRNNHLFPKIYIISLAKLLGKNYRNYKLRDDLKVEKGDLVKFDQHLIGKAYSPVRGKITDINYESGTIIVREEQNYHEKPVKINLAKLMNKSPKFAVSRIKVNVGDFVFEDQNLTYLHNDSQPVIVRAPNTGYVTKIDKKEGSITIQYQKQNFTYTPQLYCQVKEVEPNQSIVIEYNAIVYQGVIGFGKSSHGPIIYITEIDTDRDYTGLIIALDFCPSLSDLEYFVKQQISGLIIAGIENKSIVEFIGKEIGVALTGNEDIAFPIILMTGFGKFALDKDFVKTVQENDKHNCLLNPTTQVRAGVIRPKVIINIEGN